MLDLSVYLQDLMLVFAIFLNITTEDIFILLVNGSNQNHNYID